MRETWSHLCYIDFIEVIRFMDLQKIGWEN